jgi:acyl carrier protein
MDNLETEIKQLIIDSLDLEDITVADIDSKAALFNEGLGLDSIDALELGVAIKKKFGITFAAEDNENRQHFASVEALATFVRANRQ